MKFLIFACMICVTLNYDRNAAVNYAKTYWKNPNHQCGIYLSCTPYSYWGSDACGYSGHTGDDANFVSQCLLAGGHPDLVKSPCRGFPCGKEEISAKNLGLCLSANYGWSERCGYILPPKDIEPGDVLIYHLNSCNDYIAHAALIVQGGSDPKIATHSIPQFEISYRYLIDSFPYLRWFIKNN